MQHLTYYQIFNLPISEDEVIVATPMRRGMGPRVA